MIEAKNRRKGRAADDGGLWADLADTAILSAHPKLVARIDAATCEFYADRDVQVRNVALSVLRARGEA